MCRYQTIAHEMLKRIGKGFFCSNDIIREWMSQGFKFTYHGEVSPSTVLLTYTILKHEVISSIRPTAYIIDLWDQLRSCGFIIPIMDSSKSEINCGDIIFIRSPRYDVYLDETRVGLVYRAKHMESGETALWVVSVDDTDVVYTTVVSSYDNRISAKVSLFKITNEDNMPYDLHNTMPEPCIVSDGIVRWYGCVMFGENGNAYVPLRSGPGENYGLVSWCPRVYIGNFVAIYDVFSDRNVGHGDKQWFLVKVDDFCYGYIEEKFIVKSNHQTAYPSGNVLLYQSVHVIKDKPIFPHPYAIYEPENSGRYGEHNVRTEDMIVEILDINLNSSNPYKILSNDGNIDGWVRSDTIRELW